MVFVVTVVIICLIYILVSVLKFFHLNKSRLLEFRFLHFGGVIPNTEVYCCVGT